MGSLVRLASTAVDKRQAREALLASLGRHTSGWVTAELASGVAGLTQERED